MDAHLSSWLSSRSTWGATTKLACHTCACMHEGRGRQDELSRPGEMDGMKGALAATFMRLKPGPMCQTGADGEGG